MADNSSTLGPDLPYNDENLRLHRYHCMTWIYNSTVMIIGGYSSEEKTLGDTWIVEVNTDDDEEEDFFNITFTKGSQMITPRHFSCSRAKQQYGTGKRQLMMRWK